MYLKITYFIYRIQKHMVDKNDIFFSSQEEFCTIVSDDKQYHTMRKKIIWTAASHNLKQLASNRIKGTSWMESFMATVADDYVLHITCFTK